MDLVGLNLRVWEGPDGLEWERMPWHIAHRHGEWCVIKDSDHSEVACHPTLGRAEDHLRALYANEAKTTMEGAWDERPRDPNT